MADALDRYSAWLTRHEIPHTRHGNWIELATFGVVVTLTPPVSRNATMAALARVTDPDLPVLIESVGLPYGELYARRSDGNRLIGRMAWIKGATRILPAELADSRPD